MLIPIAKEEGKMFRYVYDVLLPEVSIYNIKFVGTCYLTLLQLLQAMIRVKAKIEEISIEDSLICFTS